MKHKHHTHQVIGYEKNDRAGKEIIKFSGSHLECKRRMHGYDRVEEIKYKPGEPVLVYTTRENTHQVIGYKDNKHGGPEIVKFQGTELQCKRKAHGYDRVEPISAKKQPVAKKQKSKK